MSITENDLKAYRKYKDKIEYLREECAMFYDSMLHCQCQQLSDMPMYHDSADMDKTGKLFSRYEELVKKNDEKILRLKNKIKKIEEHVNLLPERERVVVKLRYFEGLKWKNICSKLKISHQYANRIKNNAIFLLTKIP